MQYMWADLPGPGYLQYRLGQLAQDEDGAPRLGPAALALERMLISCRGLIYTFLPPPRGAGAAPHPPQGPGFPRLVAGAGPLRLARLLRTSGPTLPAAWLGTLGPRFRAGYPAHRPGLHCHAVAGLRVLYSPGGRLRDGLRAALLPGRPVPAGPRPLAGVHPDLRHHQGGPPRGARGPQTWRPCGVEAFNPPLVPILGGLRAAMARLIVGVDMVGNPTDPAPVNPVGQLPLALQPYYGPAARAADVAAAGRRRGRSATERHP
jgi:hypothetical protein